MLSFALYNLEFQRAVDLVSIQVGSEWFGRFLGQPDLLPLRLGPASGQLWLRAPPGHPRTTPGHSIPSPSLLVVTYGSGPGPFWPL